MIAFTSAPARTFSQRGLAALLLAALAGTVGSAAHAAGQQRLQDLINNGQTVYTLSADTLYTGSADFPRNITINGNGATLNLGISDASYNRVRVYEGFTATINNLTIINGNVGLELAAGANASLTNVTFIDQPQNLTHIGNGTVTVKNSTFTTAPGGFPSAAFNLAFGNTPLGPVTLNLDNVTVNGDTGTYGVLSQWGTFNIKYSTFNDCNEPISCFNKVVGTANSPAVFEYSVIRGAGPLGINIKDGGYLRVSNSLIDGGRIGIELDKSGHILVEQTEIDSGTVPRAQQGPGLALRNGPSATVRNSRIRGHMNSVDAKGNCHIIVEDCVLTDALFSAIIAEQDTLAELRRCLIFHNGQDGVNIVWDNAGGTGGIVEDCYIIDNGVQKPDPALGVAKQEGTGIAVAGPATFTLRRNVITANYDVGISVGVNYQGARAILEDNLVVANRLTGVQIAHAQTVSMTGNIVVGHTNPDQSGLLVLDNNPAQITVNRNFIGLNTYGVILKGPDTITRINDSVITANTTQGVARIKGAFFGFRDTLFANFDYQVFDSNLDTVTQASTELTYSNLGGSLLRRGYYVVKKGLTGQTRNNYWNRSEGPYNSEQVFDPTGTKIDYQNCHIDPFSPTPMLEYYLNGDPSIGLPSTELRLGNEGWIRYGANTPSRGNAIFAAQRPATDAIARQNGTTIPPGVLDSRGITLWVSPFLTMDSPFIDLMVYPVTGDLSAGVALGRVDETTGNVEIIAIGREDGVQAGKVFVERIPSGSLRNGLYYFVPPSRASIYSSQVRGISVDAPLSGENGDSVIDVADLVKARTQ